MKCIRYVGALLALLVLTAGPAVAQSQVQLWSVYQTGVIDANAESVQMPIAQGLGTSAIQIVGTYVGTIELQCSVEGTTFTAIRITPPNTTSAVTSVSDSQGLWIGSVAGCRYIRARSTAWTSGSATVYLYAGSGGGGAGSGGGGAGGAVEITEGGATAQVTVTSGGSLQVECVLGCSGSSGALADDADFADGVTVGTPVGGVAESAAPTTVTEGDFGWAAITLNRALKTSLYNAAGTAAFGTAGTAASPVLTVQGIASMTPVTVQSNGANLATETTAALILTSSNFASAFGTAGSADAQVMSIQGIASMTPVVVADGGGSLTVDGTVSVSGSVTVATHDVGSITTAVVPGTGATNLGKAEDGVAGSGDTGVVVFAVRRDSATSGVSLDGDYAALSVTSDGSLRVAGSSGTTQYVEDAAATDGASLVAVGCIRRDTTPTSSAGTAGDNATCTTDANGRVYTNTTLYDAAGTALTLAQDAGHDGPVTSGGTHAMLEAVSDMSGNSPVADGDAVRAIGDLLGRMVIAGRCDRAARVRGVTAVTDGTSTSAISAGGVGIYIEITDVIIANTSATAVTVDIRDGTAGAVMATFPVPANTSGVVMPLNTPITGSANTAVAVDPSAAASTVTTTLIGCKVK